MCLPNLSNTLVCRERALGVHENYPVSLNWVGKKRNVVLRKLLKKRRPQAFHPLGFFKAVKNQCDVTKTVQSSVS